MYITAPSSGLVCSDYESYNEVLMSDQLYQYRVKM